MTQMLVLVHGMGTNQQGWSQTPGGPAAKLNEVARRYQAFANGTEFTEELVVAEITYDFCFAELVAQWQSQSAALGSWASTNALPLPKVISWLQKTLPADEQTAKDFFWSTGIDPLLYRGFQLVRDRVRVSVMKQVVDLLKTAPDEGMNVTIVAHSLGTAVMHDVLHLLGTGRLLEQFPAAQVLMSDQWKFSNLFMVADVCMLGPPQVRDIDYFGSIVRPMPPGADAGYCQKFFEVWHRYDPFAIAAPFRPADWGPGYRPIGPLSHFREANVHGFTHYLDHPAVHIPIINYSLDRAAIDAEESAAAVAAYDDIEASALGPLIDRVQEKAKEFAQSNSDLAEIAIKISEFYALARTVQSTWQVIS